MSENSHNFPELKVISYYNIIYRSVKNSGLEAAQGKPLYFGWTKIELKMNN